MKILKIVLGVVVAAVVVIVGAAAMQPAHQHIERSKVVAASPGDVFGLINDFSQWDKWSPWYGMEPTQKVTVSENPVGKGAWYSWKGDKVGAGRMEIVESVPDQKMVEKLEFIEPFESQATVSFTLSAEGDKTKIVWGYDEERGFVSKAFGLFMDMDKMLGADFEKGLNQLAPMAEAAAKARIAAEEKAREEAAAAAALAATPADGAVASDAAAPAAAPTGK